MKKKISFGFVLVAISTVLSIAGVVLYRDALIKSNITNTLLIISAIVGCCAMLTAVITGKEISNIFAGAHVILFMAAICSSISPMVNEIGLVYAGLNPKSNLTGYKNFVITCCIGWLVGLISSFSGLTKKG